MLTDARQAMAKKAGKPAENREPARATILGLKGTQAFGDWVDRLSKHVRLPLPTLVEHSLIDYAKAHGFEEDPPER